MSEPSVVGVRIAFATTYAWVQVFVDVRKERYVDSPVVIACMR